MSDSLILQIPGRELGMVEEGARTRAPLRRPGSVTTGYSVSTGRLHARVAAGLREPSHVIGTVRFGAGRLTTCAECVFEATGGTDEEMSLRWNGHPPAARLAFKAARRVARA